MSLSLPSSVSHRFSLAVSFVHTSIFCLSPTCSAQQSSQVGSERDGTCSDSLLFLSSECVVRHTLLIQTDHVLALQPLDCKLKTVAMERNLIIMSADLIVYMMVQLVNTGAYLQKKYGFQVGTS